MTAAVNFWHWGPLVWRKSLLLVLLALGAPALASAQVDLTAPPSEDAVPAPGPSGTQRDPITTMFDNFSISLVSAHRCRPPNETMMTLFMQNLMIVQQITVNHYRTLVPDKSVDEITEMLNRRVQNLDTVVNDAIQSKGCTDPEIVKLVDSFDVNAKVDFTKKP
jgi:hypothetical protein